MKDLNNITEREKELLESLVNPDDPREKKYQFDIPYQQSILGMLLCDKVFLIQSMQLIKSNYFVDKAHETICDILFEFFEKYSQLPSRFVINNEIKERFPDDAKKRMIYTGEVEALISSYIPGLDSRDACLDKITEFAREQALRSAVSITLDLLERNEKNKWGRIEDTFRKALLVDRNFDLGLDYFQCLEERYDRMKAQQTDKEVFITGFDSIDSPEKGLSAGGICRGEIASFMGSPGTGKSILLVKVAAQNIMRGKKVLYLSLEMDQDKIARRFDAMIAMDNIRTLVERKEEVLSALRECVKGEEDKRRLIIKQFPAGTVDVPIIRAYLAQLQLQGWKPDMICVDYVGEFKDEEGVKTYESRQRAVRDLRGLATEENMAIFTAMQPNRRGREAQDNQGVIDDDMLGDSFGQARPLDALWSINVNAQEKQVGVGRIFVVKHRDGRSRYTIPFMQNKDTLDCREISFEVHSNKLTQFKVQKTADTEMSPIEGKKPYKPNRG